MRQTPSGEFRRAGANKTAPAAPPPAPPPAAPPPVPARPRPSQPVTQLLFTEGSLFCLTPSEDSSNTFPGHGRSTPERGVGLVRQSPETCSRGVGRANRRPRPRRPKQRGRDRRRLRGDLPLRDAGGDGSGRPGSGGPLVRGVDRVSLSDALPDRCAAVIIAARRNRLTRRATPFGFGGCRKGKR